MIELCYKEVTPVGRNSKHHETPKALKDFINDHFGEKHGLVFSFLSSSIKCMNADAPNNEEKRREKSQSNIPAHAQRKRIIITYVWGFSLNFYTSKIETKLKG